MPAGSASSWGFAIYRASHDDYQDNILPSGYSAGSPRRQRVGPGPRVRRPRARAGVTAATTTPCLGHDTRRVVACKYTWVVPRSRPRQRRGSLLRS